MSPAIVKVSRPWDYLAFLLAQQAAAMGDRDRALRRGDPATAADSIARANEAADILRVFAVPS